MTSRADKQCAIAWFAVSAAAFVVDRVMKCVAMRHGEVLAGDWFGLTYYKNTGIAFSIPLADALYWPVAGAAVVALVWLLLRACGLAGTLRRPDWLRAGMLWCVLLGAASNLYDRAVYGWVVDYLAFFRVGFWNIADFMIVGGLLALWVLEQRRPNEKAADSAAS
jgi:signal peptidase II